MEDRFVRKIRKMTRIYSAWLAYPYFAINRA